MHEIMRSFPASVVSVPDSVVSVSVLYRDPYFSVPILTLKFSATSRCPSKQYNAVLNEGWERGVIMIKSF